MIDYGAALHLARARTSDSSINYKLESLDFLEKKHEPYYTKQVTYKQ